MGAQKQGKVAIQFIIMPDGSIKKMQLVLPSGDVSLDRAAWGGVYLTAELIIWYFRALAAGDATSTAPEGALLRTASRTL